mmetsp:Transcript_13753/g.31991  ORF Transcript_13753/g.31991 Transcript_13753/m.31991 type:complete len:141 (-) Transcript_13753:264-686(-)
MIARHQELARGGFAFDTTIIKRDAINTTTESGSGCCWQHGTAYTPETRAAVVAACGMWYVVDTCWAFWILVLTKIYQANQQHLIQQNLPHTNESEFTDRYMHVQEGTIVYCIQPEINSWLFVIAMLMTIPRNSHRFAHKE